MSTFIHNVRNALSGSATILEPGQSEVAESPTTDGIILRDLLVGLNDLPLKWKGGLPKGLLAPPLQRRPVRLVTPCINVVIFDVS
ncbi:MAG: hypothetical protein P4L10_08420 [Acidobacteriaceae bacterium]|nr:hypothetical protein [Acidobacteriaceae bacterium]